MTGLRRGSAARVEGPALGQTLGRTLGLALGLTLGCAGARSGPDAPPFADERFDEEPLSGCIPEPVETVEAVAGEQATGDVELRLSPFDDSLTPEEHTTVARDLYRAGQQAFELGEYREAIDIWMDAYAHVPDLHALAFNIGEAWLRLRQCPQARGAFRHVVEHGDQEHIVQAAQQELDDGRCAAGR